ncbi:organic cation transporter protein-like [Limulus polyphemus]|uniref:Organic cation transporter protein-like n=1 Tax=Limulus polyphemus TaxID=6850 RepID=A0ABM1BD69_LIMPO|nr:organic cation transporter protein-like [Limulus polyphemus]
MEVTKDKKFKDETPEKTEVQDVTDLFGKYGAWQIRFLVWMILGGLPSCWNNLVIPFLAPEVDYWCQKPSVSLFDNMTTEEWKLLAIPKVGSEYSKCSMYDIKFNGTEKKDIFINVNKTIPCANFEFDHSLYTSTIQEEWSLTCNNNWLISLSQSIYMAGFLIAVLVTGQASDRVGRRPVMLLCLFIMCVAGFVAAFAPSFTVFVIARFFIALGKSGLYTTSFIHLMESCGPEHRTWLGVGSGIGWSIGYVTLPGIAWLTRDWFMTQLVITVPGLALVSLWWLIPESPRWLLSQEKMEKAEEVVKKLMKINKKECADLPAALQQIVNKSKKKVENDEKKRHANMLDLLRTPGLRKNSLVLFFIWFVTAFIFYGLSLNTNDLYGNPFLNFFIAGAVEFPAQFLAFVSLKYFGRKMPLLASLFIGGIACSLTIPVPADLQWLRTTFAMLGKLCITGTFVFIYIYSAETFPTVVRNVGVGCCSTVARIGSIIAPFVKELGRATNPNVPLGIFGAISVFGSFLVPLLPETNMHTMMDTLEQGEEFHTKNPKKTKPEKLELATVSRPVEV